MMLIKLFLFFLLLLILPDMYIYKAYIRRVSQKWTHWAYWLPSLFLLLGMTLVFSIHEPRPDSMQRLSNFLLIFLCFSVPKALFVIVILFMKFLYIISGKKLYGGYVAGGLALASLIYVIYGATEGKQHFQIREVTISSDELPSGFDGYRIVQISDIHSGSWTGNGAALQKAVNLINAQHADLVLFTGDLVNNVATELDEFIPILEQIKGKDGVYSVLGIIRKTKCFDFWERNVLFPKTKRSFFRTPTPLPCPFPLNFSLLIITKKFGNLAKNRYICIV